MSEQQRELIQQMEASWRLDAPAPAGLRGLAVRLIRRGLAPLLAQQRSFNAAALRLMYRLHDPDAPQDEQV